MEVRTTLLKCICLPAFALVAACGEQVGPKDAEVYSLMNASILESTAGLNQLECDAFRREIVSNGDLLIHAPCKYSINAEQHAKVSAYVEKTKAMPLAFGNPMETVRRSVAAELSLKKSDELNNHPLNVVLRYRQVANGGWDFFEVTEEGS
ncbi:hypothetical protein SAMN05216296_1957 [Pseudomonas pohangensis]|uniref:Lipoprotein n=1 Tax=Pseudomonas pohangensis TaxID=364197 RepID=A0A1H2G0R1_9PSED|nr:hypothetical protein [Pseudomonas pohangensis]SDU13193.1 hypothetical protein SAMN05216296_1957 [Pseudomonas pohangensis]